MNYAREFWRAYQHDRKVFMLTFIDMHEGTHEVINYLDRPLAKFIKEMEQKNTTVIFLSDHGPHLGGLKKGLGSEQ